MERTEQWKHRSIIGYVMCNVEESYKTPSSLQKILINHKLQTTMLIF